MKKTKQDELMLETRLAFRGVVNAARRLGCSREHLSRVMHGKVRPGKRLAGRLAKMGVLVP